MTVANKETLSVLRSSFALLAKRDRTRVTLIAITQAFMSLLDLIGVALFGIIASLALSGINSEQPGNRAGSVLRFTNLSNFSLQVQTGILASTAVSLLIFRTTLNFYISRRILYYLGIKSAVISKELITRVLSLNLLRLQSWAPQSILYNLTTGVSTIVIGIVGMCVTLISDFSLLLVLFVGILVIDPWVAISSVFLFGLILYTLHRILDKKSYRLGQVSRDLNVASNETILQTFVSYREIMVRGRLKLYADRIGGQRLALSKVIAEQAVMPNVGKSVIEVSVLLGAIVLSAIQFLLFDSSRAISSLSIFLVAGTRVAPAVLRIQQGILQIRSNMGIAKATLEMVQDLPKYHADLPVLTGLQTEHIDFSPSIEVRDLKFSYLNSTVNFIDIDRLSIPCGSISALVGPSGAGKTTFVDLILGIFPPASGQISISGLSPVDAIAKWPGALGYVPQNVVISNGSVHENIALGFSTDEVSTDEVWRALELTSLLKWVEGLPDGMNEVLGDYGRKMSGGQRQRLGLARALITHPKLLVLDEATSSLDGQSESEITEALKSLPDENTILVIAHRLSTVIDADQVIYMDEGRILAIGTFDEVRKAVPDFDRQAQLMGL
jgi:ABC-type multidrug transport system fused ATPase/permease subunit